jgi:hypothetical protein
MIKVSPRMAKMAKIILSIYVVAKCVLPFVICGPRSFLNALLAK